MKEGYEEDIYIIVDVEPEPIQGFENFELDLYKRMRFPISAIEEKVKGRVFVQFIVGKDGVVSGAYVAKGLNDACDREAVRLINESTPWKPGYHKGETVYVKLIQPIYFDYRKHKKSK